MLNFYDFEVFSEDWLCIIVNPQERSETTIVNNRQQLIDYWESHKSQVWVGFNSRNYDAYILKALVLGFDVKKLSDWLISGRKGWEFSSELNRVQLYDYDCMSSFFSLKQLEAFMGSNIHETSVPFDIDRKLTDYELAESVKYCRHDVEQTMQVFLKTKEKYDAHIQMLTTFKLPIHNISKTQAQLSALALGCVRHDWFDEWDYSIIDTLDIKKYAAVVTWFEQQRAVKDYSAKLTQMVGGVPHIFGWGGLHGAPEQPLHRKGLIIHVDVSSFYPSIMLEYDMLSRNVKDKSIYRQIYETRLALKAAGKKKEQAPFKIILNATYGICKDKHSLAYDPRRANEVCVNGQLLLLDLLEHLEPHCEIIQSNTDGLIIQIPDTDEAFDLVDDICAEWESRTHMSLSFDVLSEIYQKDVNNYLTIDEDGHVERKGAYVKELNDLDCDLAIINKAMVAYMVDGVPIEKTIMTCQDLKSFQKVVKVSGKYEAAWHNGARLKDKTFRVFASLDKHDTHIGKVKPQATTVEKFANTPERCFIENGSLENVEMPDKLDKRWYIGLARERLAQFGVI